jgi:hypothetical protein
MAQKVKRTFYSGVSCYVFLWIVFHAIGQTYVVGVVKVEDLGATLANILVGSVSGVQ